MVRLITHNLLACHAKGCTTNNFPLALQDVVVEVREAEFNADFLRGFLPRIEWTALVNAAKEVRKLCFLICLVFLLLVENIV
jgi:multifunctional methyltransferase subunit TRM112